MENQTMYALITGASSGIGYELARVFAENKYNLVLVARDQDRLNETATELSGKYGINAIPLSKDLFNPSAAFDIYEELKNTGIRIDVLVNDAGQGQFGLFVESDVQRDLEIIQLNVSSLLVLTKLFLKDMVTRNSGKILQVSSIASTAPGPHHAVYHATKAFVQSLTMALVNELKDTNVTITALLPGATDTDFFAKADGEDSTIVQESKLADPAEAAKDGYDALMSGESKVISGLKNKVQVAMGNFMTDSMSAENMGKQNKPSE